MAGFGLGSLDNIARQAIGGLDSLTPELSRELGEALAHSNPRRALDDWRAKAVDFNPELARILNDSNMVRLASVPEAGRIYDEFNTALMNGTAASAESYSARIVETLSLRGESAEQVKRELNQFADDFEAGIASTGLPREEALARYRQRWAAENGTGAGDGARTAEAPRDTPPRSEGFNGRAAADTPVDKDEIQRIANRAATRAAMRHAYMYPVVGSGLLLGGVMANNHFEGAPMEATLDFARSVFGRESVEQTLLLMERVDAEFAETVEGIGAYVLVESGTLTQEDFEDPATERLARAASYYALGNAPGAVIALGGLLTPGEAISIYDETERALREQYPDRDPTRPEIAAATFHAFRERIAQNNGLGSDAEATVVADAATPDTHQQGGSQAGTPAAVLADQRRRTEGGLETDDAVEAGRRLVDQARDAVASQGINSTNFSVAALSGASLASVFDKVAGDNWLMKVGNWIAGLFGERAQAGFQRLALAQSDTQEVYAAFRESAAEGRLVSNDPGSDRFGVMSLLDFGPEPDAPEAS